MEISANQNVPKPQTSHNNNSVNNFNLTSRPFTMKKPEKSTVFFPVNQVPNTSTGNFNLRISSMPNIPENKRASSAIRKENENKFKLNLKDDSKRKDAITQTEEIFFRM